MNENQIKTLIYKFRMVMSKKLYTVLYKSLNNNQTTILVLNYALKSYDIQKYTKNTLYTELNFFKWIDKIDPYKKIPIIRMLFCYKDFGLFFLVFKYYVYDPYSILNLNKSKQKKSIYKFIKTILMCLEFLHDNNYVHCDIKPSNIVCINHNLTKFNLIDFGNCHTKKDLSVVDYYITTPAYMSPEQVNYYKLNELIDIYSLGISIIELTQNKLFKEEMVIKRKYGNFNKELINTGNDLLDDLVYKMLNENPLYRITARYALKHKYFK